MNPLSIISGATALGGVIGNLFNAHHANQQLQQLLSQDPTYQSSPYAASMLGYSQQALNARRPGAASAERNIYGAQANTIAANQRGATDGSQLLAADAAAQGQTNAAFDKESQNEEEWKKFGIGNYNQALQGMTAEQQKVYEDKVRQFQDRASIYGAMNQNRSNVFSSLTNLGLTGLAFGAGGNNGTMGMFSMNRGPSQQQQLDDLNQNWNDPTLYPYTNRPQTQPING